MKSCWLVMIVVVVSINCRQAIVAGQSVSRLGGIAQQQKFQSWWQEKTVELEDELNESDKLNLIQQWLHNLVVRLASSSYPTAVASNISQQCQVDSIHYVHNLYRRSWAMQMKESSGKVPIGLYGSGNFHADGLFDECLAVRGPNFTGQYCTAYFKAAPVTESDIIYQDMSTNLDDNEDVEQRSANLVTLLQLLGILSSSAGRVEPKIAQADVLAYAFPSISFCLPSSCSADDLGHAVAELVGSYIISNYSLVTVTDEVYCFTDHEDPPSFDGPDITVIVVLSLLGLLVVIATAHDAWRMVLDKPFDSKKDGHVISVLHCFSALTNGRRLLSMKSKASPSNLACVHGIRVLSTCWVVIGHSWIIGPGSYSMNPSMVTDDAMTWWFQGISNATVSVDTFLLMGGLLVSYLLLAELDRNKGKFNIGLFYLHRYLRLTPVYAIVLGFIATLIVYTGTGPNWYNVQLSAYGCRINWWWHLLYINNLFPTDINVQCMEQTWYLATDMQLFILSPLFIYLLWRRKNIGLALLGFVFLGTIGANFAIFAVFDLMPTIMPTRTFDTLAMGFDADYYYTKPWTRAPPYIVGVWLGWFLYVTKESQKRTSKIILVIFWTLSSAIILAVIYGLVPYLDENEVPTINPAISLFYGSLHRTAWAIAVAWIVYACTRGYGGFVNRLLSWKGFLPLSRLSYCVFLIHYSYLDVFYASNRKLVYYTFLSQLTTYFGILATVFGLAFVVSITVEASFLNVEKLVFAPFQPPKPRESEVQHSSRRIDWKNKSFNKY
ncbi:nose resistant to fluoxetine protein 6-like [Daphnia carinata]|uniref:nose resistant to fluoxetine protein 6-like n=1 Tax=Daphnia carinata TaxID=120202 RepID=UPI0025799CE5|nr:nose resistant to fluoxetine protein 6-like [Daphnia carinata]